MQILPFIIYNSFVFCINSKLKITSTNITAYVYPFGMLMPGRYTRDTTVHCAVITQTMLVPQWVYVNIPVVAGPAITPQGGGTTLTFFSPTSVTVFSPMPMGGVNIAMSNLSVNGSSNISYTITTLTGNWTGQVTDSTGTIVATQAVQGTGNFSLDFVPASTTATFSLLSVMPGGTINVAYPGYKTLIYVPGTVTRTLCDNEKDKYRFGFNGKEKDNEWAGVGNSEDYGFRMLDTRTGRFRSVDPLTKDYPELTPYQFASNTPIRASDLDGKEAAAVNGQLNMSYIWGSIGARGNDEASSKDWTKKVVVPAVKKVATVAAIFILSEITGDVLEPVLAPLLLDEAEVGIIAADAPAAETPFYEPPQITETPGTTKVQKPTSSQVEENTSSANASKVSNKTHGNKLDDKSAEGYTLKDKNTGKVKKYGETTRGEDRYGTGNQKRYSKKDLNKNNVEYQKEQSGTKKDMHKWQHDKIIEHKEQNNGQRPELNKSDY